MSNENDRDIAALIQSYRDREVEARANAVTNIKAACAAFRQLGINHVTWSYDGSGDEGAITDITVNRGERDLTPAQLDAPQALEDEIYALIPEGFEINDGGFGEIILNTETKEIEHTHNDRFVDYQTSTREY